MSLLKQIKNVLDQLKIQPNKTLGQNFLINESIYKKIIFAVAPEKGETVLEIGSGLGTLTEYLAQTDVSILGIEKDHRLIVHLLNKFRSQKNVRIIEDDILKFKTENLKNFKVVGNIPYYITSHLLKIIFKNWPKPKSIVLMVQKEIAQRIKAKPPKMSLLAISVQYYAEPEIISYVLSGNFYPSPSVDSAIIKLTPGDMPDSINFQKNFFQIVKAGFSGKRKQLLNNLSREMKLNKNHVQEKLLSISVESKRRAETLTIEEWRKITNTFYSQD